MVQMLRGRGEIGKGNGWRAGRLQVRVPKKKEAVILVEPDKATEREWPASPSKGNFPIRADVVIALDYPDTMGGGSKAAGKAPCRDPRTNLVLACFLA